MMPLVRRFAAALAPVAFLVSALAMSGAPPALAHAELWQSSPAAGETVGGEIHFVTLQFFDLDVNRPQQASVFDAAGNQLPGQVNREDQRLVYSLIDPISTPGDYTVTYDVIGVDGDFSSDSFVFTWQEGAPEPAGITMVFGQDEGFDVFNFILLLVGAGLAAFIVQRFLFALREHRAAQQAAPAP